MSRKRVKGKSKSKKWSYLKRVLGAGAITAGSVYLGHKLGRRIADGKEVADYIARGGLNH